MRHLLLSISLLVLVTSAEAQSVDNDTSGSWLEQNLHRIGQNIAASGGPSFGSAQDSVSQAQAHLLGKKVFPTHDGFYLSLMAGWGLGNLEGSKPPANSKPDSRLEFFGLGGQYSLKAGIALWGGKWMITGDAMEAGVTVLDAGPEYDAGLVGIGTSYYFEPWNIVGACTFGKTSSTFIDTDGTQINDHGLGIDIQIQKEWRTTLGNRSGFLDWGITAFYLNSNIAPAPTEKLEGSIMGLNIHFLGILNPHWQ